MEKKKYRMHKLISLFTYLHKIIKESVIFIIYEYRWVGCNLNLPIPAEGRRRYNQSSPLLKLSRPVQGNGVEDLIRSEERRVGKECC